MKLKLLFLMISLLSINLLFGQNEIIQETIDIRANKDIFQGRYINQKYLLGCNDLPLGSRVTLINQAQNLELSVQVTHRVLEQEYLTFEVSLNVFEDLKVPSKKSTWQVKLQYTPQDTLNYSLDKQRLTLYERGEMLQDKEPELALLYFEEAFEKAIQLEYWETAIEYLRLVIDIKEKKGTKLPFEEHQKLLDLLRKHTNTDRLAWEMKRLVSLYRQRDYPHREEIEKWLLGWLELREKEGDYYKAIWVLNRLYYFYLKGNNIEEAEKILIKWVNVAATEGSANSYHSILNEAQRFYIEDKKDGYQAIDYTKLVIDWTLQKENKNYKNLFINNYITFLVSKIVAPDYPEAEKNLEAILDWTNITENIYIKAYLLASISATYQGKEEYELAASYLTEAMSLNVLEPESQYWNDIAFLNQKSGRYEEGLKIFTQILGDFQAVSNIEGEIIQYLKIGYLYQTWGKDKKAIKFYEKSLNLATEKEVCYVTSLIQWERVVNYLASLGKKSQAIKYGERVNTLLNICVKDSYFLQELREGFQKTLSDLKYSSD